MNFLKFNSFEMIQIIQREKGSVYCSPVGFQLAQLLRPAQSGLVARIWRRNWGAVVEGASSDVGEKWGDGGVLLAMMAGWLHGRWGWATESPQWRRKAVASPCLESSSWQTAARVLEAATSGPRCHVQRSGGARPSWTGAATPGVTHVGRDHGRWRRSGLVGMRTSGGEVGFGQHRGRMRGVAFGRLRPMRRLGCTVHRGRPNEPPFQYFKFLQLFTLVPTCKIWKGYFKNSKNFQTLHARRWIKKEQISFWEEVQIPNIIWITNSGNKTNLKLVWI
jgi:hypothetical protein